MGRFLVCFTLLGLLACQNTTGAPASNRVDQGGTSSGGPAAVIDFVHCRSPKHLIVDIALGQGRLLLLGLVQQAQDSVDILDARDGRSLNGPEFFGDQLISSTQMEMTNRTDSGIQILLNTEGITSAPEPIKSISATLTVHGRSQSLFCVFYPDRFWWSTNGTTSCPKGWHAVEDFPKYNKKLCILDENLWPKP